MGDLFIDAFRDGKNIGRLSAINGYRTLFGKCMPAPDSIHEDSRPLPEIVTALANEGCVMKVTKIEGGNAA